MSCGLLLQNPGMFTGMMQKVNPFKSTAQNQVLMSMMMIMLYHIAMKQFWTDAFGYVKFQAVPNTLTHRFPHFSISLLVFRILRPYTAICLPVLTVWLLQEDRYNKAYIQNKNKIYIYMCMSRAS